MDAAHGPAEGHGGGGRTAFPSGPAARRAATELVGEHGLNAAFVAGLRADAARERGDVAQKRYWTAALNAVREMTFGGAGRG
jgi:hypothetical protein